MRYYWLKLKTDFFRDLRVKKLRQGPNGAALTLLYQELLLSALPNGGVLPLLGIDAPAAEISLLLDAPEEDCAALLEYLSAHGLLKQTTAGGLCLPMLEDYTGSETASAVDKRRQRERDRQQKETREEKQNNASVFLPEACPDNVPQSHAEIEIEKEIEKEIDSDTDTEAEAEKKTPAALPEGEGRRDPERDETAPPLPLKSGEDFYLTKKQTAEFAALYPTVDVPGQLRAMRGWLLSNPDRMKPREEMLRFVNGWLNKQQNMIGPGTRRGNTDGPLSAPAGAAAPRSNVPAEKGYSGHGYASPPSYDIEAAMERMRCTVPELRKRPR